MRQILTLALLTLHVLAAEAQQKVIYTIHQFVTPRPGVEWTIQKTPYIRGKKLVRAVQKDMEYLGGCPMWDDQIDFPCSSRKPEHTDLLAVTGESGDWYQVYYCQVGYTGLRYAQFVGYVPKSECQSATLLPYTLADIPASTAPYVSSSLGYEKGYETHVVPTGPYKGWVLAWGEANMFFSRMLLHVGKMEKGMLRIYATLGITLHEEEGRMELFANWKSGNPDIPRLELFDPAYFKTKTSNGWTETYADFASLSDKDLARIMQFAKVDTTSPTLLFFREKTTGYHEYDLCGSLNNIYYEEGDTPVRFSIGF